MTKMLESFWFCISNMNQYAKAFIQTKNAFLQALPVLVGVLLLIGLLIDWFRGPAVLKFFSGNIYLDSVTGAALGSVASGNPITSYIIGGELLKTGVHLVAVIAFIMAWVTVGAVQLPAESVMLGRKFAFVRNIVSFVFAILIAVLSYFILGLIKI